MQNNHSSISVLNKIQISVKEVIDYLESVDNANEQILKVLLKPPILPEYQDLPWVKESKLDKKITSKLKKNMKLNSSETLRLKEILSKALSMLRKGHKNRAYGNTGLEEFIESL